jgi:hypothetical protein
VRTEPRKVDHGAGTGNAGPAIQENFLFSFDDMNELIFMPMHMRWYDYAGRGQDLEDIKISPRPGA